jgi:hypothetical protein
MCKVIHVDFRKEEPPVEDNEVDDLYFLNELPDLGWLPWAISFVTSSSTTRPKKNLTH